MGKSTSQKNKKTKSSSISKIEKVINKKEVSTETEYLSTGGTLLDIVAGGGLGMGFPAGMIINLVGDNSSGKTLLANEMIASNYHKYKKRFKYNYDDKEGGNNFDTELLYGMTVKPKGDKAPYSSNTVEEFDVNTSKFLKKQMKAGDIGLYVIDSLDGLSDADKEARSEERVKQSETGKAVEDKGTYGTKTPKFLSQEFFRTKGDKFSKNNADLLIISQVRDNLNAGMFGKKHKRSGGKALDHWCGSIMWLANVGRIKKGNRVTGYFVEAKLTKSRHPRPFRSCRFIIYFDYGIDDIGSNLNYLYDCWGDDAKLKKSAQSIPWGGSTPLNLQGLKEFLIAEDYYDKCREDKKKEEGKKNLTIDYGIEWIKRDEKRVEKFSAIFGIPTPYEELVTMIAEDPKMEKQLRKMVIDKWEAEEEAIATNRKRKYS